MTDRTNEVIDLVASCIALPTTQLSRDSSMENVPEWDSLAQLTVCMEFQERFGVPMDMDRIAASTSIEKLASLLRPLS